MGEPVTDLATAQAVLDGLLGDVLYLKEKLRRFYKADGSFELCETWEECLIRRTEAAAVVDAAIAFGRADIEMDADVGGEPGQDLIDRHVLTYESLRRRCRTAAKERNDAEEKEET